MIKVYAIGSFGHLPPFFVEWSAYRCVCAKVWESL